MIDVEEMLQVLEYESSADGLFFLREEAPNRRR